MKVQDCVFFQLTKASQAASGLWAERVSHLGVTPSQAVVLNFLGEENCIPAHALGKKLQITSATMTGILDRLENMDLVERRPHPDDRRAILVCLTNRGQRHATEINGLMVAVNDELQRELGPEQMQLFRTLLRHVWVKGS
jgi:DNA-binding MarR family transcriptional regulator